MGVSRRERAVGFSLVETLVAMAIVTVAMGGVLAALEAAYRRFGSESDLMDLEQRSRVAAEALYQGLAPAAAIYPSEPFSGTRDVTGTFRTDAVTLVALSDGPSQTTIAGPIPSRAGPVTLADSRRCPSGVPACGFEPGDTVVIFDRAGFDPFEVESVEPGALSLVHLAPDGPGIHETGSGIAEAVVRSFFVDQDRATGARRLVRQDAAGVVTPIVDGVAGVAFDYVGADGAPVRLVDGAGLREARLVTATLRLRSGTGDRVVRVSVAPRNLGHVP
jgi:type II secretory pathway pseudopilin PulG